MAFEHREGSGSLFKNDKGDNDKRPDMKGDGMVNGVLMSISAWKKAGRDGSTFLSLKIEPKQVGGGNQQPASQQSRPMGQRPAPNQGEPQKPYAEDAAEFHESDIPF